LDLLHESLSEADFSAGKFSAASVDNRFLGAEEFLLRAGNVFKEQGMVFFPIDNFRFIDRYFNSGELKFQTMASGMLKIDKVDKEPVPLIFGDTMIRPLPPGNYIVDMIYRNGYRETKVVNLRGKESAWVIFNYTPPLLVGDFRSQLPSLGINLSELNPANYEKINREAMESMGMAPFYVAYLSGEKSYKDGNFDTAISEYGRAISLKSDYTDAFVSRGNARRRKGDLDRAIEDYSRAINFNKNYAEVFNYRGFCYAQKGDFNRAVTDYTQAIRLKPGFTDAYFNRAYAYAKQGNWERAIADYSQVIKAEPSNRAAYIERGNAISKTGDTVKAQTDYTAAENLLK
jgi:tetratricopeptide (TPR) repeat protein